MATEKDFYVKLNIEKWRRHTSEMSGACAGWYFRLVLHQYTHSQQSLPNNVEELANIAGVRTSEFKLFEQVFEQVLKQILVLLPTGRLTSPFMDEVIAGREEFAGKRSTAGRISVFIRFIRKHLCQDEEVISYIRKHVNPEQIETKNQQVLKHLFEHLFKLYRNRNRNIEEEDVGGVGEEEEGEEGDEEPTGSPPWREGDWSHLPQHATSLTLSMVDLFVEAFPGYLRDDGKDHAACLQIAYGITQLRNWPWQSALNGRMPDVIAEWKEIVAWIGTSSWYRTKALWFIAKDFQGVIQAKNNDTEANPGSSTHLGTGQAQLAAIRNFGLGGTR